LACCEWQEKPIKSYITDYYDYSDIILKNSTNEIVILASDVKWVCGWNSTKANKVIYDSLCRAHNDTTYNNHTAVGCGEMKYDIPIFHSLAYRGFFMSDIKKINITSDSDFDEQHQTQILLNDIVEFWSITPSNHINSGYVDHYDWSVYDDVSFVPDSVYIRFRAKHDVFPIVKILSEISVEDLSVAGFADNDDVLGWLVFTQKPTLEQTHNFTITIELLDGRIFSKNIARTF